MSVIKAKAVEVNKIDICSPRSIIDGKDYTYTFTYNGTDFVTIQLPRCQLFTGIYESDGKCYCEIAVPSTGVTTQLYNNMAIRIEEIMKRERKFENVSFGGHMRKVSDGFACLRLKLPQNRAKITTEIVTKNNTPTSFSNLKKGATIIPIVSIEHTYVINETFGFNLLLKQVVIVE